MLETPVASLSYLTKTISLVPEKFYLLKTWIPGEVGDRRLSAVISQFQTSQKYRVFCVSNLFAKYFDCDALLGFVLDQPRGNFGESSFR